MLYYSAVNLIDYDTLHAVSTEDTLYVKENLYNLRPSLPFYFTAKTNQYITVNLLAPKRVQFCGIFNHNFISPTLNLHIPDPDAHPVNSVTGPWLHTIPLTYRANDLYGQFDHTHQWWNLNLDDNSNPNFPRIGELWLGSLSHFTQAYLQPGREDGAEFFASEQQTPYGQDWDVYLSESKRLKISFVNLNNPDNVDEIEAFLSLIRGPEGRFVLIPDHRRPHIYLVKVIGSPTARRDLYSSGNIELRSWSLDLKVLSRGITLL